MMKTTISLSKTVYKVFNPNENAMIIWDIKEANILRAFISFLWIRKENKINKLKIYRNGKQINKGKMMMSHNSKKWQSIASTISL
jgi:hypothetical protein